MTGMYPFSYLPYSILQVTGGLRNLADVTGAKEIFLNTGVIRNLAIVLGPYSSDNDVVWNVCRALR